MIQCACGRLRGRQPEAVGHAVQPRGGAGGGGPRGARAGRHRSGCRPPRLRRHRHCRWALTGSTGLHLHEVTVPRLTGVDCTVNLPCTFNLPSLDQIFGMVHKSTPFSPGMYEDDAAVAHCHTPHLWSICCCWSASHMCSDAARCFQRDAQQEVSELVLLHATGMQTASRKIMLSLAHSRNFLVTKLHHVAFLSPCSQTKGAKGGRHWQQRQRQRWGRRAGGGNRGR